MAAARRSGFEVDGFSAVDTRSAAGRMVLNVMSSVGQWEREAIGERTSAAMQHKASQGEYTGGAAPYGYAVDGVALVEVESEQAVIAEARSLRATGLSLRKVAEALDRKGLRAQRPRVRTGAGCAYGRGMKRADDDDEAPVDEVAMAAAWRRLDALIAKHPEFVGPTGPDNVSAWIETLETHEKGSIRDGEGTHHASRIPRAARRARRRGVDFGRSTPWRTRPPLLFSIRPIKMTSPSAWLEASESTRKLADPFISSCSRTGSTRASLTS